MNTSNDLESLCMRLRSTFLGLRDFHFFGFILNKCCLCIEWAEKPIISFRIGFVKSLNQNEKCKKMWNARAAEMHSMEPHDRFMRWAHKRSTKNKVQNASQTNIYVLQQIIHAIVGNHKSLATHQTIPALPRNICSTRRKKTTTTAARARAKNEHANQDRK